MTKKEAFTAYRQCVMELQEMETQLRHIGSDGRPQGVQGIRMDATPGTNHASAAAWQLADGIEGQVQRKRLELAALADRLTPEMAAIGNLRVFLIIQRYYLQAETDESIGRQMGLSTSRVGQIRRAYFQAA